MDKRCVFCKDKITRRDVSRPNRVYTAADKVAHEDCLKYVQRKYPGVRLNALEGKLIRIRPNNVYGAGVRW